MSDEQVARDWLLPDDRWEMFVEWCALHGFGHDGWPDGAKDQFLAALQAARREGRDELEQSLWAIIDRDGLGNVPSDIHGAVARLVQMAAKADAARREGMEAASRIADAEAKANEVRPDGPARTAAIAACTFVAAAIRSALPVSGAVDPWCYDMEAAPRDRFIEAWLCDEEDFGATVTVEFEGERGSPISGKKWSLWAIVPGGRSFASHNFKCWRLPTPPRAEGETT